MNLKTLNDMTPEEAQAIIKANMKDMAKIVQDAIGVLHPELAESEDERMCTRCIDLLRKVSAYSGEEYLGVEIADCIIWLQALIKKLKEPLHITEICKEDADSFTDEDERVRKKLIEIIGYFRSRGIDHQLCEEFLSYLERQKEQKPNIEVCPHSVKSKSYKENGYPIEDCDYGLEIAENILEKTLGKVEGYQSDDGIREHQTAIQAVKDATKEQKPEERFEEAREKYQVEWSEEDEKEIDNIIDFLNNPSTAKLCPTLRKNAISFLKSLPMRCPKSSDNWKPSEEQMDALEVAATDYKELDELDVAVLRMLYNDLLKLM